jgi:hypothetical protein
LFWRSRFPEREFANTPRFTVRYRRLRAARPIRPQEDNTWLPHIIFCLASPKWAPIERPSLCESNRAFLLSWACGKAALHQEADRLGGEIHIIAGIGDGLRGHIRQAR